MLRWRLKACPRCHGDVYMDRDADGWFEQCLQCSCRRELRDIRDYEKQYALIDGSKEDWSERKEE
ncbi:MAG: hypothetical protein PHE50_07430 [Dehalococcoidales bacterium]|nr:hypothetical protein [Dehalococcoidales bacterium]